MGRIILVAVMLLLAACGEEGPAPEKKVSKVADIYFRYAMENLAGDARTYKRLMTPKILADGARCVQDTVVSKRLGIYGRGRLQSLLTKHLFPADLSTYNSFLDGQFVRDTMEKRVQGLGFKSVADATQSTNLVAKALVQEYAYFARFRDIHRTQGGVNAGNLVVKNCTPAPLKSLINP
jgi:hypothetical protein